jgi:DNA helicase-2/ATP-dependent DNA helicase PcrA
MEARMRENHEVTLSDEQLAAVEADDQFLRVLASAGSGKTEVVAQRLERLLRAESGFRVLALSYTRRATRELHDRFAARLGDEGRRAQTDTIHGFAQGLLLQYGTWLGLPSDPVVVTDLTDRVDLFDAWRMGAGLPALPDTKAVLESLDLARATRREHPHSTEWSEALADAGALDYEAMLVRASELVDVPRVGSLIGRLYRHIVVDEAQNLTASQFHLLRRILDVGAHNVNAMFVGDDKQSIVGFAGASTRHLQTFAEVFRARTIALTQNFRSAAAIVLIGDAVARALGDPQSIDQRYAAPGSVEVEELRDEQAEAEAVVAWVGRLLSSGLPTVALSPGEDPRMRDREIAVLARTAWGLRACEEAFGRAGIAVSVAAHADDWLSSPIAQTAWIQATHRPNSAVSTRRLERHLDSGADNALLSEVEMPVSPSEFVRLVGEFQRDDDVAWTHDQDEIVAVWRAFCNQTPAGDRDWPRFELFVSRWQRGEDDEVGVRLHTVHKAQGREYRAVAVIGLNDEQFPHFRAKSPEDREAEMRAFYVAVTRPSRLLLLTRPRTVTNRGGTWSRRASPFLAYVPRSR